MPLPWMNWRHETSLFSARVNLCLTKEIRQTLNHIVAKTFSLTNRNVISGGLERGVNIIDYADYINTLICVALFMFIPSYGIENETLSKRAQTRLSKVWDFFKQRLSALYVKLKRFELWTTAEQLLSTCISKENILGLSNLTPITVNFVWLLDGSQYLGVVFASLSVEFQVRNKRRLSREDTNG